MFLLFFAAIDIFSLKCMEPTITKELFSLSSTASTFLFCSKLQELAEFLIQQDEIMQLAQIIGASAERAAVFKREASEAADLLSITTELGTIASLCLAKSLSRLDFQQSSFKREDLPKYGEPGYKFLYSQQPSIVNNPDIQNIRKGVFSVLRYMELLSEMLTISQGLQRRLQEVFRKTNLSALQQNEIKPYTLPLQEYYAVRYREAKKFEVLLLKSDTETTSLVEIVREEKGVVEHYFANREQFDQYYQAVVNKLRALVIKNLLSKNRQSQQVNWRSFMKRSDDSIFSLAFVSLPVLANNEVSLVEEFTRDLNNNETRATVAPSTEYKRLKQRSNQGSPAQAKKAQSKKNNKINRTSHPFISDDNRMKNELAHSEPSCQPHESYTTTSLTSEYTGTSLSDAQLGAHNNNCLEDTNVAPGNSTMILRSSECSREQMLDNDDNHSVSRLPLHNESSSELTQAVSANSTIQKISSSSTQTATDIEHPLVTSQDGDDYSFVIDNETCLEYITIADPKNNLKLCLYRAALFNPVIQNIDRKRLWENYTANVKQWFINQQEALDKQGYLNHLDPKRYIRNQEEAAYITRIHSFALKVDEFLKSLGNQHEIESRLPGQAKKDLCVTIPGHFEEFSKRDILRKTCLFVFLQNGVTKHWYHRLIEEKSKHLLVQEYLKNGYYDVAFPPLESNDS